MNTNIIVKRPLRFVSIYCPTYSAPPVLLEEMIESFLRQDYQGPKRLTILNDTPGTSFSCDAPNVRVVNIDHHIWPVCRKFDAAKAEALKDVPADAIIPHLDDDDLFLSHALTYGESRVPDGGGHWHTGKFLITTGEPPFYSVTRNWAHSCLFISRDAHKGYGDSEGVAPDVELFRRSGVVTVDIPTADIFWIYRFAGTGRYHLSCMSDPRHKPSEEWQNRGPIHLVPHWRKDYEAEAKAVIAAAVAQESRHE